MKRLIAVLVLLGSALYAGAQSSRALADSVRRAYHIPGLAYAVISSDSIIDMAATGLQRVDRPEALQLTGRFHIGSNTKAVTALLAALLVQDKKISWDTKFLDLFPDLKPASRTVYYSVTLQQLLSFRGKLPRYTYTFDTPTREEITGNEAEQRLAMARYFLAKPPMKEENGLTPSNVDYILAGLMLEKVSDRSYKELVTDLGQRLAIQFGFDYPNLTDSTQTWGHDTAGNPVAPADNYKLNWLLSAGNINISLPDYTRFIQLHLLGLKGKATMLPSPVFKKLLFGLPVFSLGWFNATDADTKHRMAWNEGNAGAFITSVEIIQPLDRAYIIFTNSATPETGEGMKVLLQLLKAKYGE